jgi:RNA polymerase sigma factor (sigma-70 family)
MNFNVMMNAQTTDDARLVELGRQGNREAFGQLVTRYQSPVCALAYSACGNIARSQDLAQETFLIAWRKLRDLQEPAKFKAWLFGIARNLINNAFRSESRNPLAGAEPLDEGFESLPAAATEANPAGQAMSREEEGILWRSLETIPEAYREPMVLFYREQQSVERVAAVLDLSEEAVRQRLSRGRKLLHERVMALVEGGLGRSAPGEAFTLGVMSALPPATLATSTSVTTGLLKGGAAGKAAVSGGAFAMLLGPLIGLLGLIGGTWAMTSKLPESSRERKFARQASAGLWAGSIAYVAATALFCRSDYVHAHPRLLTLGLLGSCFAYCAVLLPYTFWMNRVQKRIQLEEGRPAAPGLFSMARSYEYRSARTWLGLPLVHVRFNCVKDGRTLPAIGWIACGTRAYGILFAGGVVAVGGITMAPISIGVLAIGGFGIGALAFGGFAVGGLAMGGGAMGYMTFGGGTIAWLAAYGGAAVARHFAMGGGVMAEHANDRAAWDFFQQHWFLRDGWNIFTVMIVISWLPMVAQVFAKIRQERKIANPPSLKLRRTRAESEKAESAGGGGAGAS